MSVPELTPSDDLRTLIDLGCASKDKAVRAAALRVDDWQSYIEMYLSALRMQIESRIKTANQRAERKEIK